jgi:hypothetical protein
MGTLRSRSRVSGVQPSANTQEKAPAFAEKSKGWATGDCAQDVLRWTGRN